MHRKAKPKTTDLIRDEITTIRKKGSSSVRVALVYPNRYHLGMSNLGLQTVYKLFNQMEEVLCERAFVPEPSDPANRRPTTIETGRALHDFDIIAFSISFENDYPNVLTILQQAGLPLQSRQRSDAHPLIIAGGVACMLNPEPLAGFIDCFMIGEAETMLEAFISVFLDDGNGRHRSRERLLQNLVQEVPGAYVPSFYLPRYHRDGTLSAIEPLADAPQRVKRTYLEDLSEDTTCSCIITPHTTFDRSYLLEVGRGCPHGCRFCSAGFIYRPPRFRPVAQLRDAVLEGGCIAGDIGLVGAAVSDLPDIEKLCRHARENKLRISFSSLRADALNEEFISTMRETGVKTATIAPDAGSEKMRRVINKGLDEAAVLQAVELLVSGGIPNLKLYFMIGLPTETAEDVQAIVALCKKIKHTFLKTSRSRKRIGNITVSLNSFVPKPVTPFQWAAMDDVVSLKRKIRHVKDGLKKVPNVRVHADLPRWAFIQGLLSRGDRRVADFLLAAHRNRGNWPQTLKAVSLNADFYVLRERQTDEVFPWEIIDHGIKRSFLLHEYQNALHGTPSPDCPMQDCSDCNLCRNPE